MKIHELLLEYNQQLILDTFKNKFLAKWSNEEFPYVDEIGREGENFLKWFEQFDPTQNKKYMSWLVRMYVNGGINKLEDLPARMGDVLDTYERLRRTNKLKPEHKDVNRIKSLPDFEDIVDLYSKDTASKKEQKKSAEQKFYDSGEAKLMYNSAKWKMVTPVTYEANCYFGVNTKWCTTKRNDASYFEHYSSKGPLFIILNKAANKRWQFHFETNQFMDEKDRPINQFNFFFSSDNKEIASVFDKLDLIEFTNGGIRILDTYYNRAGKIHREDGPAVIHADGSEEWYVNGKIHRDDGPAVIDADGSEEWYVNGKIHREDGPAVIHADGSEEWYVNGKIHRDDGPAIIHSDGYKAWYRNGEKHRDDGPAISGADGYEEWYQNGKRHRDDGPAVTMPDGDKTWWVNGRRHREDGPAIMRADGSEAWYVNGEKHRDDGPAVINADGYEGWYRNGKLHRDDGPAVIDADGYEEWWMNGERTK